MLVSATGNMSVTFSLMRTNGAIQKGFTGHNFTFQTFTRIHATKPFRQFAFFFIFLRIIIPCSWFRNRNAHPTPAGNSENFCRVHSLYNYKKYDAALPGVRREDTQKRAAGIITERIRIYWGQPMGTAFQKCLLQRDYALRVQ
jgi:hypothetical protein